MSGNDFDIAIPEDEAGARRLLHQIREQLAAPSSVDFDPVEELVDGLLGLVDELTYQARQISTVRDRMDRRYDDEADEIFDRIAAIEKYLDRRPYGANWDGPSLFD